MTGGFYHRPGIAYVHLVARRLVDMHEVDIGSCGRDAHREVVVAAEDAGYGMPSVSPYWMPPEARNSCSHSQLINPDGARHSLEAPACNSCLLARHVDSQLVPLGREDERAGYIRVEEDCGVEKNEDAAAAAHRCHEHNPRTVPLLV
jgi:hypothetical protein